MEQKIKELEAKIYDTYYEINPDGDARFGLWKAVLNAKKDSDVVGKLEALLEEVEEGVY